MSLALSAFDSSIRLGQLHGYKSTNIRCLSEFARQLQNCAKYINFLCRQDIAELNRAETCYSTPQQQVYENLDDETKNELIAYPTDEILEKSQVYTNLPQDTLDYYSSLWTDIKNS